MRRGEYSAPHSVTTMEHSEVFRGAHSYLPRLGQVLTRFTRNRARKAKVNDALD